MIVIIAWRRASTAVCLTFPAEHIKKVFFFSLPSPLATRPSRLLLNPVGGDAQHCVKSAPSLSHLKHFRRRGGKGNVRSGGEKKKKKKKPRSPEVAIIAAFLHLYDSPGEWISVVKVHRKRRINVSWSNSVRLTSKQTKTSTFPTFPHPTHTHNFNARRRLRQNVALTVLTVFMHHGCGPTWQRCQLLKFFCEGDFESYNHS